MRFEWDEAKRAIDLVKHGIDFADAEDLFRAPHVVTRARAVGNEVRWMLTALLDDVFVTAVFTLREDAVRLISIRSARREERERYRQLHGG